MSRSLSLLVVAGLVAAVFVGGGSSAADSAASAPFAITKLVVPLFVKQNGAKRTRSVYWQGNPVFPVTVNERGICPENVDCGPRDAAGWGAEIGKTVFTTSHDPLVTSNYYFCTGTLSSNYVIGVEIRLTDAKGHRTAPVRNFWVCKTH